MFEVILLRLQSRRRLAKKIELSFKRNFEGNFKNFAAQNFFYPSVSNK